jgi:hypothetical protein
VGSFCQTQADHPPPWVRSAENPLTPTPSEICKYTFIIPSCASKARVADGDGVLQSKAVWLSVAESPLQRQRSRTVNRKSRHDYGRAINLAVMNSDFHPSDVICRLGSVFQLLVLRQLAQEIRDTFAYSGELIIAKGSNCAFSTGTCFALVNI